MFDNKHKLVRDIEYASYVDTVNAVAACVVR